MIHSLTSTTLNISSCYTPFLVLIAEANIPIINIMSDAERPKVGVGVVIHDGAGNIIMGERAGSHGAGTTYTRFFHNSLYRWTSFMVQVLRIKHS